MSNFKKKMGRFSLILTPKYLGKLPVPGRPTILITVGQGPTALAVGAGGVVWTFLFSSILAPFFLPFFGRRPDID